MERCTIPIRLVPRARKSEIIGERDGRLLIRVTAPPVDGRANTALCRLLAKAVGVGAGSVSVVRGNSSRDKLVCVDGLGPAALREALRLPAHR